jgi:hypothetical protein
VELEEIRSAADMTWDEPDMQGNVAQRKGPWAVNNNILLVRLLLDAVMGHVLE